MFAYAQRRGPRGRGEASLAEPFRGVAAGGKIEDGLFKIRVQRRQYAAGRGGSQIVPCWAERRTAQPYQFPVDDLEWRKWDNRHFYKRQGVGFDEMDEQQRELAFGLMGTSLSAKGLKLSQDIMKLNGTLGRACEQFRRVWRVVVLDHDHGRAFGNRAVGMADRRSSLDHQLLCAG